MVYHPRGAPSTRTSHPRRIMKSEGSYATSCLIRMLSLAGIALQFASAEFSGRDSLADKSPNWKPFESSGGARLVFQNPGLEYRVKSPTSMDQAAMMWTPNQGSANHDWFIQVRVHRSAFSSHGNKYLRLGLGVVNARNHSRRFTVSMNVSRTDDEMYDFNFDSFVAEGTGFPGGSQNDFHDFEFRDARDADLRIHFDSVAQTLTGSWRPDGAALGWRYFKPMDVSDWELTDADTFIAILEGASGHSSNPNKTGPDIESGEARFTDFKTGDAKPDIHIEHPVGSPLEDDRAKQDFGAVTVGKRKTITFTIRNFGTASLEDLEISKSGRNAGDFMVHGPAPNHLDPDGMTTFKVHFNPHGRGVRRAAIHISSTDPDESPFDIKLSGQGGR